MKAREFFDSILGRAGDRKRWEGELQGWRILAITIVTIAAGCGCYGFTLGLWRDPLQSLFTAIKFPLLVFLTCGGNALLNGSLGLVLGTGLGFRQTTTLILMSFAVASLILAALSPVMLFLLWSTPEQTATGHSVMLLTHVGVIAFAGVAGNRRMLEIAREITGSRKRAEATVLAWLAGNLLLGSQVSWILRPFVGSPNLPVEFFRPDAMRGNFFESLWRALHLAFQ